jgi:MFS family permease
MDEASQLWVMARNWLAFSRHRLRSCHGRNQSDLEQARTAVTFLRHPLLAVCASFMAFGTYYGAIAVSVADIERSLDVSHGVFGALLALALFMGGAASAVISVRVHRRGIGATLRETLYVWAALLIVTRFVPTNGALMVCFIATVGAAGAVDVVINTLATQAVKGSATGLLRVHATYNFGCAIGSGIAGMVIGPAILGVMGNLLGLRSSLIALACCAAVVLALVFTLPRHRRA